MSLSAEHKLAVKKLSMMNSEYYLGLYENSTHYPIKTAFYEDGSSIFDFLPLYLNSATSIMAKTATGTGYYKLFSMNVTKKFLRKWCICELHKGTVTPTTSITLYEPNNLTQIGSSTYSTVFSAQKAIIDNSSLGDTDRVTLRVEISFSTYPTVSDIPTEICWVFVPIPNNWWNSHTSMPTTTFTVTDSGSTLFTITHDDITGIAESRLNCSDISNVLLNWLTNNATMYAQTLDVHRFSDLALKHSTGNFMNAYSFLTPHCSALFTNSIIYGTLVDDYSKGGSFFPHTCSNPKKMPALSIYNDVPNWGTYGNHSPNTALMTVFDYSLLKLSSVSGSTTPDVQTTIVFNPNEPRQFPLAVMSVDSLGSTSKRNVTKIGACISALLENGSFTGGDRWWSEIPQPVYHFWLPGKLGSYMEANRTMEGSSDKSTYYEVSVGFGTTAVMKDLFTDFFYRIFMASDSYFVYAKSALATKFANYFDATSTMGQIADLYSVHQKIGANSITLTERSDKLIVTVNTV